MKIGNRYTVLLAGLCVALGMIAGNAGADGYRNPPPTAEGIAKSGANTVFVDDASAISYNPANLAGQTNASVVLATTFAQAKNTYSPSLAPPGTQIVSDDPWIVLPNVYLSMPISDGIVAGLGITTPHGQGVSWGATAFPAPATPIDPPTLYDAELALIDINPMIAMKINDSVSIGIGADIYYSELTLKALVFLPSPPAPVAGVYDAKAEGDGWGIGGNIGLTWMVTEKQRAALRYRSQASIDYKGDFSLGGDFETKIKYPDVIGVGYGVQLTDATQVEALVEWLGWSINDVQSVVTGVPGPPQVNNWDDTITAAIGGSWQFAEGWVFRSGYTFIESPIPDTTITPILPDTDRHVIGLGLGYAVGGHTLDLSYAFSIFEDKTSPAGSAAPGSYDIDSNLAGVTYSYSF